MLAWVFWIRTVKKKTIVTVLPRQWSSKNSRFTFQALGVEFTQSLHTVASTFHHNCIDLVILRCCLSKKHRMLQPVESSSCYVSQKPASELLLYLHFIWPLLLLTEMPVVKYLMGIKQKKLKISLRANFWHWFTGSAIDTVHAVFSAHVQDLTHSAFNDKLCQKPSLFMNRKFPLCSKMLLQVKALL